MPLRPNHTLVDYVVQELRQMILDGDFRPGDYLPPRKTLAQRFEVGLSTIHEAIQALTAVGMLAARPGKGTWVRPDALDTVVHSSLLESRLGELEFDQLVEARAVVEVALCEMAAARATLPEEVAIWQALDRMEAGLDDDAAFVAADLEFHFAVARAAHNDLLEQFYHLSRQLFEAAIQDLIEMPSVKENGLRLQKEIAAAIADHDVERARRAALAHMEVIAELQERWHQRY